MVHHAAGEMTQPLRRARCTTVADKCMSGEGVGDRTNLRFAQLRA
jgi:hypothetical protein